MIDFAKLTSKLIGRKRAEAEHRDKSVAAFVASVLDGKLTDEAKILARLDELGMLPEQLQARIEALQERRRLQAIVATEQAVRDEAAAAEAAWQETERQFLAVKKAHEETVTRLRNQQSLIGSRLAQIEDAKQRLAESIDVGASEELQAIDGEIARLSSRIGWLKDELATLTGVKVVNGGEPVANLMGRRKQLESDLRDVTGRGIRNRQRDPEKAAAYEKQLADLAVEEKQLRAELAELESQLANAQANAAEAREELISA